MGEAGRRKGMGKLCNYILISRSKIIIFKKSKIVKVYNELFLVT